MASRMDKAVDVVAERLNELGASHMALRAGRLNYQRQLSEELNNLLSQNSDLDEGVEDILLVDAKDMKDHLDMLKNMEVKSETIIKLEKDWHDKLLEVEEQEKLLGKKEFIKKSLKKGEIDIVAGIIKVLEHNMEKAGFISKIANFTSLGQLKKILNLKEFEVTYDNLDRKSVV